MLLLPVTLTEHEARDTLRLLKHALQSEGSEADVIVDATPLQELDSAALAVLLELERLAEAWGRPFAIRGAPAKLEALARLYGVDALLLRPAAEAAQRSPAT